MNTAPETPHDDNEISLLDLFTVLIRYRKLIIGVRGFGGGVHKQVPLLRLLFLHIFH